MKNEDIKKELEMLKTKDIYSLILFALYKMQEVPEYSVLSELVYVLDKESFLNFFEHFGGLTIKVPTLKEFKDIVLALLLYQNVNLENKSLSSSLHCLGIKGPVARRVQNVYSKICKILKEYDFTRD